MKISATIVAVDAVTRRAASTVIEVEIDSTALPAVEKDPDEWNAQVQKLYDEIPDDTLLTPVDCHI